MTSWHNALRQVGMVLKAKNLLGVFPLSDEKNGTMFRQISKSETFSQKFKNILKHGLALNVDAMSLKTFECFSLWFFSKFYIVPCEFLINVI